jgi:hypothetical protein
MIFERVLERRRFLQGAVAAASALAAGCSMQPAGGVFLSHAQSRAVSAICNAIIPDGDVPGAVAAKVPEFIDGLLEGWANATTQDKVSRALLAIDQLAQDRLGLVLADADEAQVDRIVTLFDERAFNDPQMAEGSAELQGYRILKAAILDGYFLSEIGATQAARYEAVPGSFNGCIPIDPADNRVWAIR